MMHNPIRSYLTRGVLLAGVCLAVSAVQAAPDLTAPASPTVGSSSAPDNPPPTKTGPGDREARRRADHAAFFEAHLAALHAGLQLNPAQDGLWAPMENAIRGFAKLRAERWAALKAERVDNQASKSDASIDRLRQKSKRLIARGQAMKVLADAAAPLTASLDTNQKDRLPRLLEGLKPGRVLEDAFAIDGGEHEGWRRMRQEHERMEYHGMRDDRDGRDRGHGKPGWGHHGGYTERDSMRDRRDEGDTRGEVPMRRHHHHDEEDGSDRT